MVHKRSFLLLLALLVLFGTMGSSLPQATVPTAIIVDELNDSSFPQVEMLVTVTNLQGKPLAGLGTGEFMISEEGKPVSDLVITPLEKTAQPLNLVLIMDTSSTMGLKPELDSLDTHLANTVDVVRKFVQLMPAQDQFGLITFADQVQTIQPLTDNRTHIDTALTSLKVGADGGKLYDAIAEAAMMLQGKEGRKAIVLVTSRNDAANGANTFDDLYKKLSLSSTQFYATSFVAIKLGQLEKLAELTGGHVKGVEDSSLLGTFFEELFEPLNQLRSKYQLNFRSNLPADGQEHELLISVKTGGTTVEQKARVMARKGGVSVRFANLSNSGFAGGIMKMDPIITAPAKPASLEFFVDGVSTVQKSDSDLVFDWDTTSLSKEMHQVRVVVKDTAGNSGEVNYEVMIQDPLTVRIQEPLAGSNVTEAERMIAAEVTAFSPLKSIEFKIDGTVISTLQDPAVQAKYEAVWDVTKFGVGSHKIEVIASDANGFTGSGVSDVYVNMSGGSEFPWIALIGVIVVAGIVIPLALRARKKNVPAGGGQPGVVGAAKGMRGGSLYELEGINPNQTWPLTSGNVSLGRKRDENDIPLKGLAASRQHAVIREMQGKHVLYCVKPENPVIVNNASVQQKTLEPGDVIRMGESVFRYDH